jgi:hypothetical protein
VLLLESVSAKEGPTELLLQSAHFTSDLETGSIPSKSADLLAEESAMFQFPFLRPASFGHRSKRLLRPTITEGNVGKSGEGCRQSLWSNH